MTHNSQVQDPRGSHGAEHIDTHQGGGGGTKCPFCKKPLAGYDLADHVADKHGDAV